MASAPLSVAPWVVPAASALGLLSANRGQKVSAATFAASATVMAATVAPRFFVRRVPSSGDPADGREGSGAQRLRIMSANVFRGAADPYVLMSHLQARHPDVLAMQEQSPGYLRQLVEAGIEELLPYRLAANGSRLSDAAIFSRHPLEPFPIALPSVFVGAMVVLPTGRRVPFISAHPLPPATPGRERHWRASLSALPAPEGELAGLLIAGDFNATLDHPEFRAVLRKGWRDAAAELGKGGRMTWSGTPFLDGLNLGLLRMTIDHVLVPPGARALAYRVDRLHGSDHRLLTAVVELPPG